MDDLVQFLRARLERHLTTLTEYLVDGEFGIEESDLIDLNAKRRIVDGIAAADPEGAYITGTFTAWDVLRLLALPYAQHPDYQPEWSPDPA